MPSRHEEEPARGSDDEVDLRRINERLVISGLREQELAETAERERAELSELLEALSEGVVIAEHTGLLLLVNSAARTLLGFPMESPRTVADVEALALRSLDGAPLAQESRPLRRAMNGEVFADAEMLLDRANGPSLRVTASGTSIEGAGKVKLAIVVWRDVTERRSLEARVAQAERLATLGTMTAGVAHEINNPLAYIVGNVDFVLAKLPELQAELRRISVTELPAVGSKLTEVVDALIDARAGCVRVRGIVDALGCFGGVAGAERTALEVTDVLESALRFTEKRVRLSARLRRDYGPTPRVSANQGQLEQVFTNLLINAAQSIGEGSADDNEIILASFTDSAGRAVAEVRDSGHGIAPETLARIFDPFFTTRAIGEGSGLGLSICHSIAKSLGGELSAHSKVGLGTTVRLVLPALEDSQAREPPPAPVLASDPPPLPARRGRVLVIDDEPAIGRVFSRLLQAEHEVVVLTDAEVALSRLAAGEQFDVVLCDLMMPTITGMDFYARLLERHPDVARKVVLVTGGAFSEAAQAFMLAFPNPTLKKPIDRSALRLIVSEYVSPSR